MIPLRFTFLPLAVAALLLACTAAGSEPGRPVTRPSIWPTDGRPYAVTSGFAVARRGGGRRHEGIDIDAPHRSPVVATADGRVTAAGPSSGGYGRLVILSHGAGLETRYAHLSSVAVRSGQRVRRGELLGRVGRSGRARGSHLHYEVHRNGEAVDPRPYLSP